MERTSSFFCDHDQLTIPIFAYWGSEDQSNLEKFVNEWHSVFSHFRVLGDKDIIFLVKKYFPEYVECYTDIKIPAAKSDIARLLVLFEFGGLFTDCHFGIVDGNGMKSFLDWARNYDAVFVDNALHRDSRAADELLLINGFIFSKSNNNLLYDTCKNSLLSLNALRESELRNGFQNYSIWHISGPWVLNKTLFNGTSPFKYEGMRAEYARNIAIVKEEHLPVKRNIHKSYSAPGQHWSERQKTECLFSRNNSASNEKRCGQPE
jgi:hypothetical protein